MTAEYLEVFPTVILRKNLGRTFSSDELSFVKDKSKYSVKPGFSVRQSHSDKILEDPALSSVKAFVETAIQDYLTSHKITDVEVYITQSWLNLHNNREPHPIHLHPNSYLSGVIYFTGGSPIRFERTGPNVTKNDFYELNVIEGNEYNSSSIAVGAEPGRLLLFPSYVPHYVPPTPSNLERISLAFNTYFKGKLGQQDKLTLLNL